MSLLQAIASADRDALDRMLADEVVFHSPVQTYRGRDQILLLLTTVGGVLDAVEASQEIQVHPGHTITFFAAEVEGHPVDGVLDERHHGQDRIREITVMLRPLAQLQAAVARMARALADPG